MAKLNYPNKVPTSLWKADEANLIKQVVNENADIMDEVSHAFSEEDFQENGTTTVNGKVVPVIEINPTSPRLGEGFVTPQQLTAATVNKADVIGGTVPVAQLPVFFFDSNDFEGDGTEANPFKLRV